MSDATVEALRRKAASAGIEWARVESALALFGPVVVAEILDRRAAGKAAGSIAAYKAQVSELRSAKAALEVVSADELERRRLLAEIPDAVWDILTRRFDDNALVEILNDVLKLVGIDPKASKTLRRIDPFWRTEL